MSGLLDFKESRDIRIYVSTSLASLWVSFLFSFWTGEPIGFAFGGLEGSSFLGYGVRYVSGSILGLV